MTEEKILSQDVLVSDLLVTKLKDRVYAESLMGELGVRLHFDIPWSKMHYYKHYRDDEMGGELWRFRSKPFKEDKHGVRS